MDFDQQISRFLERSPAVPASAFIAANATVIGDVTLGEDSSVWFQAVIRADINSIRIGPSSNIQDGAIVHLDSASGTTVGELVTVGHKAIVHACTISDEVLVGMNSVVLDGAVIGARSIVGAGALITGGRKFPPGSLILGSPAKVVRELDGEEQRSIKGWAERYVQLARKYRERGFQQTLTRGDRSTAGVD